MSKGSTIFLPGLRFLSLAERSGKPEGTGKGPPTIEMSNPEVFITMGKRLSPPNLDVPGDSSWGKTLPPKVAPSKSHYEHQINKHCKASET